MSSPDSPYNPSTSNQQYDRHSSPGSADEDKKPANRRKSSKKKSHVCRICQKTFTTSGHLSRHQRTHTGERAFACPWPGCLTRCSRQDNLQQHYRTHLSPRSRKADLSSAKAMRAGIKSVTDVPKELLSKGGRTKGSFIGRKVSAKTEQNMDDKDTDESPTIPFNYLSNPQLPIPSTSSGILPAIDSRRTTTSTKIHPVHLTTRPSPPFAMSPSDNYPVLNPISHLMAPSPESRTAFSPQSISPTTSPMEQTKSTQLQNYSIESSEGNSNAYEVKLKPKVNTATPIPVIPPIYRSASVNQIQTPAYATSEDRFIGQSTSLPGLNLELNNTPSSSSYVVPPARMYTLPTNIAQSTILRPTTAINYAAPPAESFDYTAYQQQPVNESQNEFYQLTAPEESTSLDFNQQWNTQYY
ncbi:hypothetical protein E3Q18_03826 [Wallemia mellicola]|uniref:C2H2-type domain-containing protein n=1 Tax=Wallemia mellicola TaxID=1708541 RepID=A0A4T0SEC9_9BASI|nr:hypothetical protein E3Q18_03826 [Wallemia mellicola]TIB96551.1 hypothetical protein E3Q17_03810 [Wallemia mellicola]TIC25434.1 hypothetical protein E3Q10_03743 [Wallemia mellicola]TIC50114.1 hypothetical protein E3Q05_03565 [Wallemia mellicola]